MSDIIERLDAIITGRGGLDEREEIDLLIDAKDEIERLRFVLRGIALNPISLPAQELSQWAHDAVNT